MAEIKLTAVDELANLYSFQFALDNQSIGYHVTVEFKIKKRCNKKFFSFLPFVNDCDPPTVEPLINCKKHDAGVTKSYIFKANVINDEEDENCRFITIKWKCWERTVPNPVNPLSGSGAYKGLLGKAGAELEETADWSGDCLFQVCCAKGESGKCELKITKL